jgi:hypothetical protein
MNEKMNRKARNKVIERQKKNRNRLFALVAALVGVAVIAVTSWVVWDTQSQNWILRFEGERIHTNEFRFMLAGMGFEGPQARQNALDELIEILTIEHRALRHDIYLSEGERDLWTMLVSMQTEGVEIPFITAERLGEIWATDSLLERLMDVYVPEHFVYIDEESLAVDIQEYIAENLMNYLQMDLMYILFEELEEAEEAHARFMAGEIGFEDIIREYHPFYEDGMEMEIFTLSLNDFIQEAMLNDEEADMLRQMQAGDIADIMEWGEMFGIENYLLVYAINREEPDEMEIAANFRNRYIFFERSSMLQSLIPQWVEQADFTINRRAFNRA